MTFVSLKSFGSLLLRGKFGLSNSSVFLHLLCPDSFPQESYVLDRSIQCLHLSVCLDIYFCLELLHSGLFSSWWIQMYQEDVSEVLCSVKPSLPLSDRVSHVLAWT